MDALEDILIPIVAILVVFGTAYGVARLYLTTRSRERLALIAKGMSAEHLSSPRAGLRWAIVLISIGIGIFMGYILSEVTGVDAGVAYSTMILIFAGVGYVLGHWAAMRVTSGTG